VNRHELRSIDGGDLPNAIMGGQPEGPDEPASTEAPQQRRPLASVRSSRKRLSLAARSMSTPQSGTRRPHHRFQSPEHLGWIVKLGQDVKSLVRRGIEDVREADERP
jgi:hypothetical protein